MEKCGKYYYQAELHELLFKQILHGIHHKSQYEIVPHIAETHKVKPICHKQEKGKDEPVGCIVQSFQEKQAGEKSDHRKDRDIIIHSHNCLHETYKKLKTDLERNLRIRTVYIYEFISVGPVIVSDTVPHCRQEKQHQKYPYEKAPVYSFLPGQKRCVHRLSGYHIQFSAVGGIYKESKGHAHRS